jgi:type IV secretory pathway VirB10-like protein
MTHSSGNITKKTREAKDNELDEIPTSDVSPPAPFTEEKKAALPASPKATNTDSSSSSGNKPRVYRESGPRELAHGADLNSQLMALMDARVIAMTRSGTRAPVTRTPRTVRGIAAAADAEKKNKQQQNESGKDESQRNTNAHDMSHSTTLALSRPRQRPASVCCYTVPITV